PRRGGPKGKPVETVKHGEEEKARGLRHVRQNKQRRTPQHVSRREDFPRIDAVYQPPRKCCPNETRPSHDPYRYCGGHLRNAFFDSMRDQVSADETVGRNATDKKAAA